MSNTTIALPRSTPEAQGISSEAILSFLRAAEKELDALHSFVLVRHGAVVAEGWWHPYEAQNPHVLFSLSKSFTSTAAGFAVAEGRFTLDDRVVSFFPDDLPEEVSPNLEAMTVRDLLIMGTGNAEDTTGYLHRSPDGNWAKAFLARPVEHTPGTHFVYNSGATYMVAAILHKTTGESLLDYLTPRLLAPLGIEGATWEACPRGIHVGGWGLSITTDAIAKFGQLYLRDGVWNGRQVLPVGWVQEATSKHISNGDNPENDWNQGYGYQFWRCRHNAYRGDGAFGQFCVVLPDQDAVVAITAGLGFMGSVLELIWDELLPAMRPDSLPENPTGVAALRDKLSSLRLPAPEGAATSPTAGRVSGQVYSLAENEPGLRTIGFEFSGEGATLALTDARGTHTILCGTANDWRKHRTTLHSRGNETAPVAAVGAWTSDDTYTVVLYYTETPFRFHLRATFGEDTLDLETRINVSFGPTDPVRIAGQRQP
ncbi:MAG: serine hydrolase [Capsulimonadales bacterium]|nr:serine hydrolase [Capsulimonadales bacterium]